MDTNKSILRKDDSGNWYVTYDKKWHRKEFGKNGWEAILVTEEAKLPLHKGSVPMIAEYGLSEGDSIDTRITSVYVEPDDSIHCNRGSEVDYASIQLKPFIVRRDGMMSVIAAPTFESVIHYCDVKYNNRDVYVYFTEDITFTNTFYQKGVRETDLD